MSSCALPWQPLIEFPESRELYEAVDEPGLFAGGWQATTFGGEGVVTVGPTGLDLGMGNPLTGTHLPGFTPPDPDRYELRMHAERVSGNDFFCALTFPVGVDQSVSLVLGGWGGGLCGLSCIDGADASSNATKFFRGFAPQQRIQVRIQVRPAWIRVWLDGELVVNQPRDGHRFEVRTEMLPCTPLGLASFQSAGRITRLDWRP